MLKELKLYILIPRKCNVELYFEFFNEFNLLLCYRFGFFYALQKNWLNKRYKVKKIPKENTLTLCAKNFLSIRENKFSFEMINELCVLEKISITHTSYKVIHFIVYVKY